MLNGQSGEPSLSRHSPSRVAVLADTVLEFLSRHHARPQIRLKPGLIPILAVYVWIWNASEVLLQRRGDST